MKICPRCNKTYTDEELNFCLDDGSVLEQAGGPMPETVLLNQPRATAPVQQMPSQQYMPVQASQAGWNTAPQQYSMQPKKSSKTWVWVVLILGVLAVFCGGGLVGLIYVVSQSDASNTNAKSNFNFNVNGAKGSPSPSNSKTGNTSAPTDRTALETIDLSTWNQSTSQFGKTEFKNGEYLMAAKQKGYYYVIVDFAGKGKTENANTSVTVRNVDDAASVLGYGLVFHSNPSPLKQDYAFLIDAKTKRYRVVRHSPQKEDAVISWTKSDAIVSGTSENTLEVRDLPNRMELYINGTLVNSTKNDHGYSGGVAGLYSGDGVNVAFKNLELRK